MAIYNGRILMRKGLEADFDASKLMSGEWAVSLDAGIVRICLEAGKVIRMATYEAFEEDMKQIEAILLECQSIEEAVRRINTEVSEKLNACAEYVQQAKNYSEQAKTSEENAKVSETNAKASENNAKESENNAKLTEERAREVFESIPEDYSTISNDLYELAIKETASGEEIHVNDSANVKLREFALFGKAKQNTTSGKNLLENTATSQETKGLVFTVNEDKSVTVKGTSTAEAFFSIGTFVPEIGKTYTINGLVGSGSNSTYMFYWNTNNTSVRDLGSGATVTITDNTTKDNKALIVVRSGVTVDFTIYPMISLEGGEYEPFTNGASPNPSYPQEIEVSGESYNLLENTATSQTINGVEFVVNEDGSVTANGTASKLTTLMLNNNKLKLKVGAKYIISGYSATNNNISVFTVCKDKEGQSISGAFYSTTNNEFTVVENTEYMWTGLWIESGAVCENLTFYPMIRKASVKNDRYMPYGKGSVEVKSVGKNLCEPRMKSATINNTTCTNNGDGTFTLRGTPSAKTTFRIDQSIFNGLDNLKSYNGKYSISIVKNKDVNIHANLMQYKNETYTILLNTSTKPTLNIDTENAFVYVECFVGVDYTDVTFAVQLEENEVSTEYQPYKETISTIPTTNGLAGIKVSSGGNYTDQNGQQWICDEIVKYADGSGERIQKLKYMKVETVLNMWSNSDGSGKIFALVKDAKNNISSEIKGNVISNMFETRPDAIQYNSNVSAVSLTKNGRVCLSIIGITNKEDMQAFVDNNDMYILYELANPIHTPLTAEELAEIEKLHTFYPVTNISNDFDCGMSVTYYADSKNYIDKKISELATAMVNNI